MSRHRSKKKPQVKTEEECKKEILQDIGYMIRKKRKEMKLTQDEFAKLIQSTKTTVGRWEAGECMPSTDAMAKIMLHTGLMFFPKKPKEEKSEKKNDILT